jgi:hypothetical protein
VVSRPWRNYRAKNGAPTHLLPKVVFTIESVTEFGCPILRAVLFSLKGGRPMKLAAK